jgi:membrane-bound serine protease (ClpP class)
MPEGLFSVVGLLALGYILLFLEIFVPGGVLGVLGGLAMVYACYLAFGLSPAWGTAAVGLSVIVALLAVRLLARSRIGRKLVLEDRGVGAWKAAEEGLGTLVGREGRTLSTLRPAGLAEFDGRRLNVVADSEFLASGVVVRVCEVEGNRVVVEAVEEDAAGGPPEAAGRDRLSP